MSKIENKFFYNKEVKVEEKFNGKKVVFDKQKALKLFEWLNQEWQNPAGIFKNVVLPQDKWPNQKAWNDFFKSDRQRANWLFYNVLPMRGGIMSEDPFKVFWEIRQNYPDLFDPELVYRKWNVDQIAKAIRLTLAYVFKLNNLPRGYKIDEHARNWYLNSINLYRDWDNDIRNVFKGVTDFEQAFARIDYKKAKAGFKGMRRKIFALLTIWLQEKGFIPIFPTSIPVDFHALRILLATQIIQQTSWDQIFVPKEKHPKQLAGKTVIRTREQLIDLITWWSQKFIWQNNFSHLNINPALWVLSRSFCSEAFQNTSQKNGKRYFEAEELGKNPYLWPKNYKDPCSLCPLEKDCQWAIPAVPHYKWGLLVKISKRIDYPVRRLPFVGWEFNSLRNNRS